jgi:hypothetical protein
LDNQHRERRGGGLTVVVMPRTGINLPLGHGAYMLWTVVPKAAGAGRPLKQRTVGA